METINASIGRGSFQISGDVVFGDTAGDPDVPNGSEYLDPYVNNLCVMVEDQDVTGCISEIRTKGFCSELVEAAREG